MFEVERCFNVAVRDHIPLEQGLRPIVLGPVQLHTDVRDHIPLEQGLRRKDVT